MNKSSTWPPKTSTPNQSWWKFIQNPRARTVIYGVTDRRNDHWLLKTNDYLLDHQRFSTKEKARFFHSLKLLVNSGVQFIRALSMLGGRTKNVRFARTLHTIAYDMEHRGRSFSQALEKYPQIFSPSEVKMVYSGELTGKIEETLNSIANQMQKNIELEMRVRSALMYPATVLAAIFLAAVVVMIFIVPRLMGIFSEFGAELPWATRLLLVSSDFLTTYWWLLLAIGLAGFIWFRSWLQDPNGRRRFDAWCLELPAVGFLINQIQTVRISQNFATLVASGIPLNKALRILGEIVPNRIIGEAIFNVEIAVRQGARLHESFAVEKALDPVLGEILEVGEKTGKIDEVLQRLGDQYELEVDAQLKNISTLIEPLILVLVGGAVIFMMFAVLSPIFQIQELFTQG